MSFVKEHIRKYQKLPTWFFALPAGLLWLIGKCFVRVRILDPDNLAASHGAVAVTWHNRLMLFPAVFPKRVRQCTAAVVSASRDGQYVADLISYFGIRCARGSSRKHGAAAQLEAVRFLKDNVNVCFTPDGPRGPKYKMSRGPVHLASVMRRPLLPIAINYHRYWELPTWDGFQIPKPFTRVDVILGPALDIPPELDDNTLEQWRVRAEQALAAITEDRKK